MKIYAVYARVELTQQPEWLGDFRAKYNNLYDYHVTLKQPAFIDESQLPEIQQRLAALFVSHSSSGAKIQLVFDDLQPYREDSSIVLFAQPNQKLLDLQREIVSSLRSYSNYMKPELKEYEEHFQPHLTLAFHLDERFDDAVADLGSDVTCVGEISEIVLSCVREISINEAKNPANLTVYAL